MLEMNYILADLILILLFHTGQEISVSCAGKFTILHHHP